MATVYKDLKCTATGDPTAIYVRCTLVNRSNETWKRENDFAVGWQLIDPDSGVFITEGEWHSLPNDVAPGAEGSLDLTIQFPSEPGRYHVYVSPVREAAGWEFSKGEPFLLIAGEVENGRAKIIETRTTTTARLRRERLRGKIPKLFTDPVTSIWKNRGLIRSMVRRDIMARYRGSFGDFLWTILNPLLLMGTYFFVFGLVLKTEFPGDNSKTGFVLYFLAGMLPWLAFSEAMGRASHVIIEHRNFVKKLVFPLETLPVNMVISGMVTEFFAVCIFMVGILIARGSLHGTILWLPALLIPQLLLTAGLCWFLAAMGAYFRDLGQVMGFVLTLWFFITPICYPDTRLPKEFLPVLGKNPIYILVQGYRAIFLEGHAPQFRSLWKLWAVALTACIAGHAWFHKLKKTFADVI